MIHRVAVLGLLVTALIMSSCGKKEEEVKKEDISQEHTSRKAAMSARDPVCSMFVDRGSAVVDTFEGEEYHFCSEDCRRQFLADPHGFLKGTHVFDPVCRMRVEYGNSPHTKHEGKRYHFCSKECRAKFEQDPERYLKRN